VLGFTLVLLAAGFETTKNLLGNAIWVLHQHPDDRARLVADPSLIPTAIEEVLRFESPVIGLARTTTRDVDVRGVVIPQGARVQMNYASANRDDRAFVDAARFDLDRTDQRHLAFGHGIHFCLGAALARLEARVALEELLGRFPTYRVLGLERLPSAYIRGFASLRLAALPLATVPGDGTGEDIDG
jgi:cytochrome P450